MPVDPIRREARRLRLLESKGRKQATLTNPRWASWTPAYAGVPGQAPDGSYEDLQADLLDAAKDIFGEGALLVASYPDNVIVIVQPAGTLYRIPYTLDTDGEPVLGSPELV